MIGYGYWHVSKDKLFNGYIDLEIQLRNFDNCRRLARKFLEFGPNNSTTWIKSKAMEKPTFHSKETFFWLNSLRIGKSSRWCWSCTIDLWTCHWTTTIRHAWISLEGIYWFWNRTARIWSCKEELYSKLLKKTQHVKLGDKTTEWTDFK